MNWRSVVLLAVLAAPASAAQGDDSRVEPTPVAATALDAQMAELNRTVKRLVELVELLVEARQSELLVQRLEVADRELHPLEEQLREARSNRDRAEQFLTEARARLDDLEGGDANSDPALTAIPDDELRQLGDDLERQIRQAEQRVGDLEAEALRLGLEIQQRHQDRRALEELLDQRLGLRR